jgi:GAF domain-containing protein
VTGTEEWVMPADTGETFDALARVARALRVQNADLPATLDAIVTQVTEIAAPVTWAGLIELERGRLVPKATYGEPPRILDQLQQILGTGPCVDAARDQQLVAIDDMTADMRWPEYTKRATELGVRVVLCAPLWIDERRLGTLSLYGDGSALFGHSERRLLDLYATLAAMALADGQRVTNLTAALDSRDLIGQAKGILIERLKVTAEDAFAVLSQASQKTNRKLAVVAEELVRTGVLDR